METHSSSKMNALFTIDCNKAIFMAINLREWHSSGVYCNYARILKLIFATNRNELIKYVLLKLTRLLLLSLLHRSEILLKLIFFLVANTQFTFTLSFLKTIVMSEWFVCVFQIRKSIKEDNLYLSAMCIS